VGAAGGDGGDVVERELFSVEDDLA